MRKRSFLIALAVGAGMLVAAVATAVVGVHKVRIEDKCDPASFNAVVGPGTCVAGGGNVTFSEFFAALADGGHKGWRFIAQPPHIKAGMTVEATNTGGEVHTFTEVAAFGGGFIPALNGPLGLTPIPECVTPAIVGPTFLAAGASLEVTGLVLGLHRFECCIHPWMRAEIDVR